MNRQQSLAWLIAAAIACCAAAPAQANFTMSPNPGFNIFWLGGDADFFTTAQPVRAPANLATAGTAFGSGALVFPHTVANINNGQYGNTNSWISAPTPTPFIGVALGGTFNVNRIAFGRDNGNNLLAPVPPGDCCGGQLTDRNAGTYTFQYTTVGAPGAGTGFTGNAATGWANIGTITYNGADDTIVGGAFTPWFRHAFGVTQSGNSIAATGIRIVPPNDQIAIDELEVYAGAAARPPLRLNQVGGTMTSDNLAVQPGATAFASGVLVGFPSHNIPNLNDGLYGNSDSWIGDGADDFVGINLGRSAEIYKIAFGRDNGGEAQQFMDRTNGSYVLQYTNVANPNASTPDSAWTTIGGLSYDLAGLAPDGTPWLRHAFEFDPVFATGIRLWVGPNGLATGVAIDELEVYATPEPAAWIAWALVGGMAGLGLVIRNRYGERK